jgi:hypothetical protein
LGTVLDGSGRSDSNRRPSACQQCLRNADSKAEKRQFARLCKRLMGLEPTTFCMLARGVVLPAKVRFAAGVARARFAGFHRVSTGFCHPIVTRTITFS